MSRQSDLEDWKHQESQLPVLTESFEEVYEDPTFHGEICSRCAARIYLPEQEQHIAWHRHISWAIYVMWGSPTFRSPREES